MPRTSTPPGNFGLLEDASDLTDGGTADIMTGLLQITDPVDEKEEMAEPDDTVDMEEERP